MIGIDTNVLLRFLVEDEPEQSAAARRFMAERTVADPAYISSVVLAETIWFLTSHLEYPKQHIVMILASLAQLPEIVVEHSKELKLLLADLPAPTADLADYLIAWSAQKAGCTLTMTFDRKAAKAIPGMDLIA